MNIESARRVMETDNFETANQYLRFGWSLINQYAVEATAELPARVKFVLASVKKLEDTRQVAMLNDPDALNQYLHLGWKLIDKYVTCDLPDRRHETIHFVVAWQSEETPLLPGMAPAIPKTFDTTMPIDDEL